MAGVTRTRADLILRTLKLLGAAGVGQTPTDDDKQAVEEQIDTTIDMLEAKNVCQFPSRQEFLSALIQPFALRLAGVVAPDFGISKIVGYEQYSLEQVQAFAEGEIRFIVAEDMTNEPIRFVDY